MNAAPAPQAFAESKPHGTVAAAAALFERLRNRAAEADKLRRLPDATVADMREAGLYRILQPAKWGGHQASLHVFIDALAETAKGCGSSAWCLGVVNAHHWLSGLFPEAAQREVFEGKPDALVSAVIGPRGTARPVEGGYVLKGFWPFCSGSPHADWLMLGGRIVDAGKVLDEGDFLIEIGKVEVKDDWDVGGLRASGSNSVVVDDVFVPAHRFLSIPKAIEGFYPGADNHEGWLYRSAFMPVLALGVAPAALGLAEGAIVDFKARLPGKIVSYTFDEKQLEMPTTHMQLAMAESKTRAARLLLHAAAENIERAARAGEAMDLLARAQVRMDISFALRLCLEAIEMLFLAAGGSALATSNPIQRAHRDVHAINMHGLNNLETNLEMYGRVSLGLPQNSPLI
jgi:3-hydroxy-9,10-secoandrosta-1,3,5(10)-triene-9,17-dione monooxygenase